jgi:hypothetical protein
MQAYEHDGVCGAWRAHVYALRAAVSRAQLEGALTQYSTPRELTDCRHALM